MPPCCPVMLCLYPFGVVICSNYNISISGLDRCWFKWADKVKTPFLERFWLHARSWSSYVWRPKVSNRTNRLADTNSVRSTTLGHLVYRVEASMMALIFLGFTTMPSRLTTCPRRASLVTPNLHLTGLRLSRAER